MYALTTPAFEASDELWHYPMIRHLADGNPLPVQVFDPDLAGPWKQEASQPPLYYYAGAALTFWIDTADMADVRLENPHVDNGLITRDGNSNLVVHDPRSDPWKGTLLAVRLVRLLSVMMSAVTVYLTYRIAGYAVPGRPEIALGAAAVNAFLPMFLFISGAVNNDNLAIMLASLGLLIMILIVAANYPRTSEKEASHVWQHWGSWLVLGIVIGLALLTKEGTIGLLPLAWGTCFVVAWAKNHSTQDPEENKGTSIRDLIVAGLHSLPSFLLILLPVVLIAGWWYWRNVQLYGDWLGWSAFIAVLGERAHPASLLQLWGEGRGFLMAYWGLFGGVNIPMPDWVYAVFNGLLVLAVVGFIVYIVNEIRHWLSATQESWQSLNMWIDNLISFIVKRFALVLSFLFAAAVVFGLIRWATTTWSSQGRLVFTAISALSTLFATGLAGWMSERAARWTMGISSTFFLVIAAAAPFLWIGPAYQPENYNLAGHAVFQDHGVILGDRIQLRKAAVEKEGDVVQPGDGFWVHLDWKVKEAMDGNWSTFVHAVDPVIGQPIAQRDMYPGQGLVLTSWLEAGESYTDSFYIEVPQTAVSPANLEIVTGYYDVQTGERLTSSSGDDTISLGTIPLQTTDGGFPNSVDVEFEDVFELSGYAVEPRSTAPGGEIALTLYWRPLRQPEKDYTFFAQVVDEDTTRWASIDYTPPEGTSSWPVDKTQPLALQLIIAEDTPGKVYPLILGVYTQDEDGNFDRLQIRTSDGRLTDDFLELTLIRIDD